VEQKVSAPNPVDTFSYGEYVPSEFVIFFENRRNKNPIMKTKQKVNNELP
jgi:hypothetical protein